MSSEFGDRVVVAGSADLCAHAAQAWKLRWEETITVDADGSTSAVSVAGAPRLFGDPPALVGLDVAKWNKADIAKLVASGANFMLCVITAKKLTAGQHKTWNAVAATVELDRKWRDKMLWAMFASHGVKLDRGAKILISERNIDLSKATSMVFAANQSGLGALDERKARVLLGEAGDAANHFAVVDRLLDHLEIPDASDVAHIEAVVLAGHLADTLKGLIVVAEAGATGSAAAVLAGAPPFKARDIDRRVKALREVLEPAFVAACDADVRARTERLSPRDVCALVAAALVAARN